MPRKSHEFKDGRCTRCGDREDRAGELCFLTDWEHSEIDFDDGLVNAAIRFWWDDMRPREVRGLAIEAYMRGRLLAPMGQPELLRERNWYKDERDRLRQHLIDEGREDLTEEPDREYYNRRDAKDSFWIEDDADGYWCCHPGCPNPANAPDVFRCTTCGRVRPAIPGCSAVDPTSGATCRLESAHDGPHSHTSREEP